MKWIQLTYLIPIRPKSSPLILSESMLRSVFVCSLLLFGTVLSAQSIQRSTLSAFGGSTSTNGVVMQTCVGQPSPTANRQGFIQPPLVKTKQKNAIQNIRVYPLPSNDMVSLEFSFKEGDLIHVFDMNAAIIAQYDLQQNENIATFSLGQFGAGRYSAVVYRSGERIALGTIIITK
jgi:hypothetical protein